MLQAPPKKITRPNKLIWPSSRIQNQYSEIHCISIYRYQLSEGKTKKIIPFTVATKKSEVPRKKFNQGDERAVFGKL